MLKNLETAYVFKFEKMSFNEVESLMLKTSYDFEFYVPKEDSKFMYVVGAVYSKQEIENLKVFLEINDKELLGATIEELNSAQSLVGFEYRYLKNVYRGVV